MEIFQHLNSVRSALETDLSTAVREMAGDILDYLDDEVVMSVPSDPFLLEMIGLLNSPLAEKTADRNRHRNKTNTDKIKSGLDSISGMYKGVPENVSKHGYEAHTVGYAASRIHHSAKASRDVKVSAHETAKEAHSRAAAKCKAAGYDEPHQAHKNAARWHDNKIRELFDSKDEAVDMSGIAGKMKVAGMRMQRTKNQIAKKKTLSGLIPAVSPRVPAKASTEAA